MAVLTAGLTGKRYIVYSNEKSSDYGNLNIDGFEINHQFTKSLEFERAYKKYLVQYVNPSLEYFSLLKPIYELQISKIFAGFPQYHDVFVSCNTGKWCRRCSKCSFIYMSLFPFMDTKSLTDALGRPMLDGESLLETYKMLLGETKHKPFECVGTVQENRLAMKLAISKGEPTFITNHFGNILEPSTEKELQDILYQYDDTNHTIPKHLTKSVKLTIDELIQKSSQPVQIEAFQSTMPPKVNKSPVTLFLPVMIMVMFLLIAIVIHRLHIKV